MKHIILLLSGLLLQYATISAQAPSSDSIQKITTVRIQPKPFGPELNPADQVSRYIRRILQDRRGNIWFGTQGDGACRYDGKNFVYFKKKDGLGGDVVRGMLEDAHGDIWFATNEGVTRYDPVRDTFFNLTIKDGLSSQYVWCLMKDAGGTFWFGTEGGVNRYDPETGVMSAFPLPAADLKGHPGAYPAPKLVNCIFQDRDGKIWFATNGRGLFRYDGKSLVELSEKDGLSNNFVQSILQDRAGLLWFGTRFGGLCSYDGTTGKFRTYTAHEGLPGVFVWTVFEDRSGILWLGTAGGGLQSYDPVSGVFTKYDQSNGLMNQYVQSILQDQQGTLWIGTSGGVFRKSGDWFFNFIKTDGC